MNYFKLFFSLSIGLLLFNACSQNVKEVSSPLNSAQYQKPPKSESEVPKPKIINLKGRVEKMERPAPDIPQDYRLILSQPFMDKFQDGYGAQEKTTVILEGYDSKTEETLKTALQEKRIVEVQGYMEWSYAESRVFSVLHMK